MYNNKGATLLKLPRPSNHVEPERVQLRRVDEAIKCFRAACIADPGCEAYAENLTAARDVVHATYNRLFLRPGAQMKSKGKIVGVPQILTREELQLSRRLALGRAHLATLVAGRLGRRLPRQGRGCERWAAPNVRLPLPHGTDRRALPALPVLGTQ